MSANLENSAVTIGLEMSVFIPIPKKGNGKKCSSYCTIALISVQFNSVTQLCPILCDPMNCSTPGLPICHQLPEFTETHIHGVCDAIHPFHPLSSASPPAPSLSQHQSLFQWVNSSPKYWSFSFNISPSNEHLGLISFRMDWLYLLAVQGTLKSLVHHHSSKASVLQHSAFLTVQLSHPYMTTGKTITLTRRIFVGKIMSLLLNMLSRLVVTFLPSSKQLLIWWLQSPFCSDFGAQKNKVSHGFHCFPIYFPWSDGSRWHDLSFQNVELFHSPLSLSSRGF